MDAGWTARCCSALALTVASSIAIAAQSDRPRGDLASLALFPIQTAWTIELGHDFTVPPAFDEARAYFATGDGRVAAYELTRGHQVWSVAARPQIDLATGGGLVFIVEPNLLTARRATDGAVAWQAPLTETLSAPPVSTSEWLVVPVSEGAMHLFHTTDGRRAWRRDLPSLAHARPALIGDRVYVPTIDGHLVALHVSSGDMVWERRLGGQATDMLAAEARIYLGATDNFLYCLNARDGRIEWRWRTGADVIGVPVVDDRNVYFVSLDNVLRALSRTSGAQRWFRPLPLRPTAGPILAGTTLVVPGLARTLPAFDAATGAPAGELSIGGGETDPLLHVVSRHAAEPPGVVIVTRDAEKGARATLVTRQR